MCIRDILLLIRRIIGLMSLKYVFNSFYKFNSVVSDLVLLIKLNKMFDIITNLKNNTNSVLFFISKSKSETFCLYIGAIIKNKRFYIQGRIKTDKSNNQSFAILCALFIFLVFMRLIKSILIRYIKAFLS